ncbi:EscR/YscR/HrcR family type III secretion system export apparatus protein [Lysobacter firmicutimachus]|uniref:EscR/YscR/HrcR family type III secretion system export apparatus protein n=1 Tax=Lysobacter firmicutimachus TaxID=1792846 RepID=A0ABU8D8A0_9GAMM
MDFSSFSPALVLVTVVSLALAPFVAVMVTSFTKIVVVLSLLRNALGLQQVPPNVVINGLAIVLSIYVMYPVILETHDAINARLSGQPAASATQGQPPVGAAAPAGAPAASAATAPAASAAPVAVNAAATPAANAPAPTGLAAGTSVTVTTTATPVAAAPAAPAAAATTAGGAGKPPSALLSAGGKMDTARLLALMDAGKEPLRKFLIKHSSDAERAFFLRSAQRLLPPAARGDISVNDFIVVIPAFTVSELTAAFQIGFLIFLPFLIIDLVVSNILLSLGMMMLSPTTVSLPFKLLLFVLIGGWAKLVHGLVLTYGG